MKQNYLKVLFIYEKWLHCPKFRKETICEIGYGVVLLEEGGWYPSYKNGSVA